MSSVPPSSTSSFQSIDAEYHITTTTTTVVHPPHRGTTPVAQSPPCFTLATPVQGFTIKREATPSTPLRSQSIKLNLARSPVTTPGFNHKATPFSPPASPTKACHSGQYLLKSAVETRGPATLSFEQLCPRIPHPDEFAEPDSLYPPVKKWYTVTVSQDVGIFSSWLDVVACICGVPHPAQVAHPTYSQALAEYRRQYDIGEVKIILIPGSTWAQEAAQVQANGIQDKYDDEYDGLMYDEEVEDAIYEAEVYAKAQKAYDDVLITHGFLIPKKK
ncbi:hypothetical protein ARMSODRAFT_982198 [Armillaria solidipes]|uniref:Uncharacterized protein n=1 Tax=Armillaria solidipes TaxID=1076256 RepID=A0A2H3ANX2_9AGAR|nr:hypothetical protein ARMSODRAFT_982198 [Armillaria solidipes]